MSRYFIDLNDGDHLSTDEEGQDFETVEAAEYDAIALLPDIARQVIPDGDRRTIVSTLRTEAGVVILTATLTLNVKRTSELVKGKSATRP